MNPTFKWLICVEFNVMRQTGSRYFWLFHSIHPDTTSSTQKNEFSLSYYILQHKPSYFGQNFHPCFVPSTHPPRPTGGEFMEPEILLGEFDTLLLDNSGGQAGKAICIWIII